MRPKARSAPASLTFTPANWNVAQTVTVTGVDDAIDDGDVTYSIVTAAATSADTVTPTSGLTTTEAGGTATFTVVLTTQPTADVTIALSSGDATEGTVASGEPDVHAGELERRADRHRDRRGRCRGRRRRRLQHRHRRGDQRRPELQRDQCGRRRGHQHRQRRLGHHRHADRRPDHDGGRRHRDVHGRADESADGECDDCAQFEATRRRRRRAGEPDVYERELEHRADRHRDRRRRHPGRRRRRLHDRHRGGGQHRRDLQRVQRE